ncbi:hypothetical protein [Alcaligenes ammonioxydans]|uniref:hypothetical protein n=1 Tax=Alcaligenes ammonioxydans TaxID=2582914 RepID=UPI003D1964A6
MSKAAMPQPVAYLQICRKKPESKSLTYGKDVPALKNLGYAPNPLFSAGQLEAYAADKVREALEEAEEAVTTLYESEELPLLPDIAKAINACMTRGK